MSYVESHQELGSHPKTKRSAKQLGLSIPTLLGHLHLLWHWALDYAPDGNLAEFSADEIAEAALWEGDPELFIEALVDCGPGKRSGFLERTEGRLAIHDWDEYGGKLFEKRRRDMERKRETRRLSAGCPPDVQRMSAGCPTDGARREEEKREDQTREEKHAPTRGLHRLVLLARSEIPGWEPDDQKDEALIQRHLKRLPERDVEQIILELAGYRRPKGGSYKDLCAALNRWLAKASPPSSSEVEVPRVYDGNREEFERFQQVHGCE